MMAENETDAKRDELERENLQRSISEVETALAVSTPGTRGVLENFLRNAKGRVEVLDKRIKEAEKAKEEHAKEMAALVTDLAQKETALSQRERETYSGFLAKEFFTEKDFSSLGQFYEKTWDRLSDGGKDQMSHRVWEGIRRDEYKFTELPNLVQEKETERAYSRLRDGATLSRDEARIPRQDRADFVHTYETGKHVEAGKILERESFKENLFRDDSRPSRASTRETALKTINARPAEKASAADHAKTPSGKVGDRAGLDVSAVNLDGLTLADADSQTPPAAIDSGKMGNLVVQR